MDNIPAPDTFIRDILDDYLKKERNFAEEIKECRDKRHQDESAEKKKLAQGKFDQPERMEAEFRNQRFLKDLEEAKARLRTIASFTPTDQELRDLAGAYRVRLGNVAQSQGCRSSVENAQ